MQLTVDLMAAGLGEALGPLLPAGVRPKSLSLDSKRFRLEAQAPLVGAVALVARVESKPGCMLLTDFDLEGAGLAKALALGQLRREIGRLDRRRPPFHVWGEPEGDRLWVRWDGGG